MSDDIYIDVNYLTESERDVILQVLAKDDELRRHEKKRLGHLKTELDTIKFSGLEAHQMSTDARVCARCKEEFGVVFNTGAFCPKCKVRVCKNCRSPMSDSWLCLLCSKVREVKAKSGAWFFENEKKKVQKPALYGSVLLRASLKRSKKSAKQTLVIAEPPPPRIINLNLNEHGKLYRPVPVHMSPLKEQESTALHDRTEDRGEYPEYEVNRNYKTYSKAIPVSTTKKGQAEEVEIDRRSRSSSDSSTPALEDDHDQIITSRTQGHGSETSEDRPIFDYLKEAEDERPVFDYIKEDQYSSHGSESHSDSKYDGQMDGLEGYTRTTAMNGHVMRRDEDEEYREEERPGYEDDINRYSYQSSGTYHDADDQSSQSQDSLLQGGSIDTMTTGEFFTPRETPGHSDANTPVQSSPEPTDGDRLDYMEEERETTPVMMDHEHDTAATTHQTYSSHGLNPPQIITTGASDDDRDEADGAQRTMGHEEGEDIDQAFAEYGVDTSSQRLAQQFDMGSRESIVSYYSDAGEGHYGNVEVTGEVQLGLRYDFKHERLEVQVHRARDIAAVDTKKNKSDPYIKVYLLPDKTKGGKRKTKTKKHTLNPTFDEILSFKVGFDEMLTRTMWLALWNHDRFGHNDFLGEVMLPLGQYEESGFSWSDPMEQWYPLRERRPEPSLMKYCGEIIIALKYVPAQSVKTKKKKKGEERGELHVVIKEARNLPAKDANGFSDPFCKTYLLPDKGKKSKRKTQTIKKNLNPVWSFPFVYDDVTLEDLMDRALELTVWDWDRGASNDFLGGVRLGMGTKMEKWDDAEGEEITAWQAMLDFPNEWHDCTLALRSSMDSRA